MYYSLFKQTKIYLNSWKYSKSPGNWIEGKIISFKKKNSYLTYQNFDWFVSINFSVQSWIWLWIDRNIEPQAVGLKYLNCFWVNLECPKLNLTVNRQKLVLFWNETERETGDCFKYQSRMPDNQGRLLGRGLIFMTFSS